MLSGKRRRSVSVLLHRAAEEVFFANLNFGTLWSPEVTERGGAVKAFFWGGSRIDVSRACAEESAIFPSWLQLQHEAGKNLTVETIVVLLGFNLEENQNKRIKHNKTYYARYYLRDNKSLTSNQFERKSFCDV